MLRSFANALLLCLFFSPVTLGASTDAGETIVRQGQIDDDYYAAGGQVTINATVSGDVIAAGGDVSIDSQIGGDLNAAGGSLSVRGSVADDLRIAGGDIELDVEVGDDLMVTGGQITLSPGTSIDGDVRLAAGKVTVAGTVNGDLSAAVGRLAIAGRIAGDVEFIGDQIDLLDGAVIEGDLVYRSPQEIEVSPQVTIAGNLLYEQAEWQHESGGFGFVFPLTLMIAGVSFLLMFPGYSVASAKQLAAAPLNSAGLGLLWLVFAPIVAIILMVTVVGLWLGLVLLFAYAVALLAGYLVGCIFIGDWGGRLLRQDLASRWRRITSVVLAILLLAIISMIPLIGWLVVFALLLTGIGAGIMQLRNSYRQAA